MVYRFHYWIAWLLLLTFSPLVHAGQRLGLTLDGGDVQGDGVYPVSGGIPFARGDLEDPLAVNLLIASAPVPLQTKTLATWPDGSVKWLLLSFVAPANVQAVLEYGAGVQRPAVPNPLTVLSANDSVTVDTGSIRFSVKRGGSGFIDELWLDPNGKGNYGAGEKLIETVSRGNFCDFVHAGNPQDYPVLSRLANGQLDQSTCRIVELQVEESGPVRAVILIRGQYLIRQLGTTYTAFKQHGLCPFTLRLSAYRGTGIVQVEHFFVYEGDPDYDFLRCAGLAVNARLDPKSAKVECLTAQTKDSVPLADGPLFGLYQDNADYYRAWQAAGPQALDRTVRQGARFEGVLDVSDRKWGVAVAHRRMWQNYATGFGVDARGGRVSAYFWPPEANLLDFRRYAREWGVGETGADSGGDIQSYSRIAAKGCGKTHSALFIFHPAGVPADTLLKTALVFDRTLLLKCTPAYYAQTRALGYYRTVDKQAFPEAEAAIQNTMDLVLDSQQRFRWYGFFNYGCIQSRYNEVHRLGRWDSDFGRWGWSGNDGGGRWGHGFMLEYLRYGDRRYFEEGEANVLNNYDTWVVHTKETFWDFDFETPRDVSGLAHRHNVQPFGCPYVGARGSYPVGMKIYYYLTGSGRARDGLDEVLTAGVEYLSGKLWRLGHSGAEDGLGTAAQSLLCAWERTGDKKYPELLYPLFSKKEYFEPKTAWVASMTTAFGLYQSAREYYDLTGDKALTGVIVKIARLCNTAEVKKSFTYPSGYFSIFGDAYYLTKDPEFAQACQEALKIQQQRMANTAALSVPPAAWPARLGGPEVHVNGNLLKDLPYLFETISSANKAKD